MHSYAKLAKNVVDRYVRTHQLPSFPPVPYPDLDRQKACYIHIFDNPGRRLRAVAGHPLPRHGSLAQEIFAHTITAVKHSRRPIRRPDLAALAYTVAVLDPLQRISHADQLNPATHGLYIHSDHGKVAVILPNRPGIETAQDQIATAMREAHINPRQEIPAMYRFAVSYYE